MVIYRTNSGHLLGAVSDWTDEAFILELRHALRNIYDPDELNKSRLIQMLSIDDPKAPSSLQNILVSTVQELKPDSSLSSQSDAWRIYNILNSRYIQQFHQEEVARSVGLSPRQMRRVDRLALMAMAEYIWTRYKKEKQPIKLTSLDPNKTGMEDTQEIANEQSNEIKWLKQTQSKEVISVLDLILAIQKTIEPLTKSLSIAVEYEVVMDLPDMVIHLLPIRQAVLTLLSTLLNNSHDGTIHFKARSHLQYDLLTIEFEHVINDQPVDMQAMRESLRIASQLVAISGGAIEIVPSMPSSGFEQILLTIPASEQVVVLVVDDNEDTLLLFQRYLTRSHYLYIGAKSYEQALAAIEHSIPHIIVLDVMMPDVDGWELLEHLREHPKTRECPIIMCSILPQEQLALMFGAAAFLRKPVTQEALQTILDELSWHLHRSTGLAS